MANARPGDPALDSKVVQSFAEVLGNLVAAVGTVHGDDVLRNLGQDTLDEIETSMREARIEIDRSLLVFGRFRTIRSRQAFGGVGSLNRRLTALEQMISGPEPQPMCDSAGTEVWPASIAGTKTDGVTEKE